MGIIADYLDLLRELHLKEEEAGFATLDRMQVGRSTMGTTFVLCGGKEDKKFELLFLVGGREAGAVSDMAECYDVNRYKWIETQRLFFARENPAVCAFNAELVFVFGGQRGNSNTMSISNDQFETNIEWCSIVNGQPSDWLVLKL